MSRINARRLAACMLCAIIALAAAVIGWPALAYQPPGSSDPGGSGPGGAPPRLPAPAPGPDPRFRDPTQPSPEMREAIEAERFVPKPGGNETTSAPVMPQIRLKARLIGAAAAPTAVLDVNGQLFTVRANSEVMLSGSSAGVATLIVRELSPTGVLVEVLPLKKTMLLN